MQHVQGGAEFQGPKKTKTALKKAIKDEPDQVYLYCTSFTGGWCGLASDLPEGTQFNVVGPDPHTKRDWYANVTKSDGKLRVS